MILAAYIVPALFVLARFRKVILSSRGALAFFALGLGLFVVAGAFDVIGVGIDELVAARRRLHRRRLHENRAGITW